MGLTVVVDSQELTQLFACIDHERCDYSVCVLGSEHQGV